MPGLIGIVSENTIDQSLIDKLIVSLNKDDYYKVDKFLSPNICIGRVHLGIYNPTPQPIFNEDRTIYIFMDGKIYDYENNLIDLEKKGYKFELRNDSEFCLHSYEEYGIEFINKLNGNFVIIICDLYKNEVIIANDRYGLRPLNYTINNGNLVFSPEINALFEDKTLQKKINDFAIADFFAFGRLLGNKTFFENINIVPPASIMIYKQGKISIEQYWDFPYKPNYEKSDNDFVDELVEAFKKAIQLRLKDDLKYGISLSGGMDSRCIAAAISKDKRKVITAFPHGPITCDDVKIAKKVAVTAGMEYKILPIDPMLILENTKECVIRSDGLIYLGFNYLPKISKDIRKNNIDVIFNGMSLDTFVTNPWMTKEIVECKDNIELSRLIYKMWVFFSNEELSQLFTKEYYSKIKDYPNISFKETLHKYKDDHPGNLCDHFDNDNYGRRSQIIPIVLLRTALEISTPAFDNNFVDISLTIPPELRLNHYIYRKFLRKLSPELIKVTYNQTMFSANAPIIFWKFGKYVQRTKRYIKRQIYRYSKGRIHIPGKQNYVNYDDLFRINAKWIKFFKDLLLNENAFSKKYINQKYIESLFKIHKVGKKNNSHKILYLASFEIFLKTIIGKSK